VEARESCEYISHLFVSETLIIDFDLMWAESKVFFFIFVWDKKIEHNGT